VKAELQILREHEENHWFFNAIMSDDYGENGLLKGSRLNIRVQDIISEYIAMEDHFLFKSIEKVFFS
jgi:hypothetical protein